MGKLIVNEQKGHEEKAKNIKNIYVAKINSLMRVSRDSLTEQDLDMYTQTKQKKINKLHSESRKSVITADKATSKLEKNRQSARKARQRKNLYIKLLEHQVTMLREIQHESEKVEKQSAIVLETITFEQKKQDELDKYLSRDNLQEPNEETKQIEEKIQQMDYLLSELQEMFAPDILINIASMEDQKAKILEEQILSQFETNQQLTNPQKTMKKVELRNLMKAVLKHKNIQNQNFKRMATVNESAKHILKQTFYPETLQDQSQIKTSIRRIVREMKLNNVRFPQETYLSQQKFLSNDQKVSCSVKIKELQYSINQFDQFIDKVNNIQG